MPKEEWGTKRVCPETGKRFYDLNADPVVSPYSGKTVPVETGKTSRTMVADKADKASKTKKEVADELVETEEATTEDEADVDLEDDVLDDDEEEDTVPLEEIADVAAPEED